MMMKLVFTFFSFAVLINAKECDPKTCAEIPNHYIELGCKPITESSGCCPIRYECPAPANDNKCHHKGKSYNPSEEIPDAEQPVCQAGCRCTSIGDETKLNCANIECPDLFGPPPSDCVKVSKFGQCCGSYECDKDKIAELSKTKCHLDGKEYVKGSKMYPNEESCHTCICDEGFDNKTITTSPHCKKVECNIELHYSDRLKSGCIPIYYEKANCCPIEWRCPKTEDEVVVKSRADVKLDDPNMSCKFGKLNLNLSDELNSESSCVTCSCLVPPMVHCIKNGIC